jgi:hypothetical protein
MSLLGNEQIIDIPEESDADKISSFEPSAQNSNRRTSLINFKKYNNIRTRENSQRRSAVATPNLPEPIT